VDGQVRDRLRAFGRAEGMPDSSASNVFAVNRQMRGQDMIGYPDLRLGANTISDVSLTPKDGRTDQLRRWNVIRTNDTIIMRPTNMPGGGGAYVVPRSTIAPVNTSTTPRRGG
jgi:hypothetical protein